MYVLRIEHPVADFTAWKAAFDSDPAGRKASGVRSYRVLRGRDDPSLAMVDLEFDTTGEAESMLASLRQIWSRVDGTLMTNPQAKIVETIEAEDYSS